MSGALEIEVCYAQPGSQVLLKVQVPPGTSLREAVERSGIRVQCPQIDPTHVAMGVYGRLRDPAETVSAGDRIEIYRPLAADPKAQRHRRVADARRVAARERSRPRR